jgi:mRNA interferase MazF
MTRFEPGDVCLVQFPFTDLTSSKRRPAVIVSRADYPQLQGDFVLLPLTSQPQSDRDLAIVEWKTCGLPKPTWVKPIIGTISGRLLVRAIGKLSPKDHRAIRRALGIILDVKWHSPPQGPSLRKK